MPSNSPDFAQSVIVVAGTYLLHSTILLMAAWLAVKIGRVQSHVLAERLWKMAAVLGLVTAPLQVALGWSSPILDVTLGHGEGTPCATGEVSNNATDDSFYPVPARGSEDAERLVANTAAPNPEAIDTIELAAGFHGNGGENRDDTQDGESTAYISVYLPDDPSDHRPAASTATTKADVSRIHRSVEPPQKGRTHSGAATQPHWPHRVVSPSTIARCVFGGATLIAGFVVCGWFMLLVQTSLFNRRCAGSSEVSHGTARRTLDRLLQRNFIRRQVRLLSSDVFQEPVAFGLSRWTIVLPDGMQQRLGKGELKALLAHELAHFTRGDVSWLWIGRVLCSCLAFQPLNFLARRRWQHAAEFLCDDWAVGRGGNAISLARCLTRIAEWRLDQRECAAGLGAGGSKARIVLRVERLVGTTGRVDTWTSPLRRGFMQVAALVTTTCLVCVAPRVVLPANAIGSQDRNAAANTSEPELTFPAPTPISGPAEEWRLLEGELFQLDRDMSYVFRLLKQTSDEPEIHKSAEQMRRHVLALQDRRHVLAERTKKELDR